MDSLFILIPIALVLTIVAIRAFFWTVDNKQYDDLDIAAKSILFDDAPISSHKKIEKNHEPRD